MAETDVENTLQPKGSESNNTLSKLKDSSLTVLTGTPIQSKNVLSKSLARGLDEETCNKPLTTKRQYTTSFDDLVDHRKTLYTCYSSRAVTMYNVSSNLKDHTGSTLRYIVDEKPKVESLPNELIENMEELDNIFSNSYNYHYEIQQLELQPYPDDNVIPFLGDHIKQLIEHIMFEDKISLDYTIDNNNENNDNNKENDNTDNTDNTDNNDSNKENDNNDHNKEPKNEEKTNEVTQSTENNDEDPSQKKINILNWLSVNQIVMELEKWRISIKNQNIETLSKNNTANNIIGDQATAEKTANHILNYSKWDRMKVIEQTLPYSLSLKSSGKKSSYTKYHNIQEESSPLFYSANELSSPSPLSAPPLQYPQRLELQPNEAEKISTSPETPSSINSPNTAI
ncbi:hypothetical protein PIROE2DRAFT_63180 [Piromyces sp. E2]|nr:hypothetical protein PIROE2DRAFT_63180 [Piromyces sp. E2]|eukprot:OUM60387.1 hypothetical protein PIROE2DRAFT_63180 [Piromyces sp. E2]